MQEKELDATESRQMLEQACAFVSDRDLPSAVDVLERALQVDFDDPDVITSLKYVKFWHERERQLAGIGHEFERGQFLLDQWPLFDAFAKRMARCEPCIQAIRRFAFGSALDLFDALLHESDAHDPELLLRIGRCHKGMGAYDSAVTYLEAAAAERPSDAEVTAELADAYALTNDVPAAKAFFREAFFLDPQRVHLRVLESQMIQALTDKAAEFGHESDELLEWLPVYGVLYGVFNVKRELRSIEYGKLKQSIYSLERELRDGRSRRELVEPRLINRYFWLIDHLIAAGEDAAKVDEVLLKLRALNERVYRLYTN